MSQQDYFQHIADISAIFWEFHQTAIAEGLTYPTVQRLTSHNIQSKQFIQPFNLSEDLKNFYDIRDRIPDLSYDIIDKYALATNRSLAFSWTTFLFLQYVPSFSYRPFFPIRKVLHFHSPDVLNLLEETEKLAQHNNRLALSKEELLFPQAFSVGMNTGSLVVAQLSALFYKDFRPNYAKALSEIDLRYAELSRKNIGICPATDTPNYSLIRDGRLDVNALKNYGFGEALDCPAGWPPTTKTQKLIQEITGEKWQGSMLTDFARYYHEDFIHQVEQLYENSTEGERGLISPHSRDAVEGHALSRSYGNERR